MSIAASLAPRINAVLGILHDVLRSGDVPDLGPHLLVTHTWTIPANATQTVQMTVPASAEFDLLTGFTSAAGSYVSRIEAGALLYYTHQSGAAPVAPAFPFLPMFSQGMLKRIRLVQGDSVSFSVVNTTGAPITATGYLSGYRVS